MRKLDAKLGRIEAIEEPDDPMLARASPLGGEHEARALENYKTTYADGVVEIETEDARADPDILVARSSAPSRPNPRALALAWRRTPGSRRDCSNRHRPPSRCASTASCGPETSTMPTS
jgi:hypothetical protein